MTYDRKLARRNIEAAIKRTEAVLAEPRPENPTYPGARASHTRHLAEARDALEALNEGEQPEGWA